jgi:flagellar biosynthesis protein FliP
MNLPQQRWAIGTAVAMTVALVCVGSEIAVAQGLRLDDLVAAPSGPTWARIVQSAVVLTALAVAPGLLMVMTCFPRFLIAFSFLRAGLGLPSTPSNIILISLALFLTLFVMAPVMERAWDDGLKPLSENKITPEEAFEKTAAPFRAFMQAHTRPVDLALFLEIGRERMGPAVAEDDLRVLVPAFMISELRRGFEIGFLILLPFLVIDLVVSMIVMSLGMMMLSPQVFSLPMKVLFFVLIDGWSLLVGSLVKSLG